MERRRGKTPEETSVLFHATLASRAALWGWADDWKHQSNHVWDGRRGHPELLATNLVCLFKALISHSVMFFLEHGYFSGTVISAIPHQVPFWALSLDRGSAMLIKCLTDGLNSSICYNRCPLWWEEINHHTWWTEAQWNQIAAMQPQMWSGLLTNYTRIGLLIPKPNWLLV